MARDLCLEHISPTYRTIRVVSIIIIIIGFIFICFLGCVSLKQFKKLTNLEPTFERLFHTTWILSSIALCTFLISTELCAFGYGYWAGDMIVLQAWLLCIVILSILLTLLFRLYFTFRDTIYALTTAMKVVLITLFITLLVVSLCNLSLLSYAYVNRNKVEIHLIPVIWLGAINGALYIITTVIAIAQFATNLMKLTESRQSDEEVLRKGPSKIRKTRRGSIQVNVELNREQKKLIQHTTKYVGLLSIGISTSVCTLIILIASGDAFGEDWNMKWFQVAYIFLSLDATINITCLYLQYTFAKEYYNKYCKLIHLCWNCMLTRTAERSISRRISKVQLIEDSDGEETQLNLKPDGTCDQSD
eukprot:195676_1